MYLQYYLDENGERVYTLKVNATHLFIIHSKILRLLPWHVFDTHVFQPEDFGIVEVSSKCFFFSAEGRSTRKSDVLRSPR